MALFDIKKHYPSSGTPSDVLDELRALETSIIKHWTVKDALEASAAAFPDKTALIKVYKPELRRRTVELALKEETTQSLGPDILDHMQVESDQFGVITVRTSLEGVHRHSLADIAKSLGLNFAE